MICAKLATALGDLSVPLHTLRVSRLQVGGGGEGAPQPPCGQGAHSAAPQSHSDLGLGMSGNPVYNAR